MWIEILLKVLPWHRPTRTIGSHCCIALLLYALMDTPGIFARPRGPVQGTPRTLAICKSIALAQAFIVRLAILFRVQC